MENELTKRLDALADVDYDTMDGNETQHGCQVEINYDGEFTVWLTDECCSGHTAVAVEIVDGEYTDNYLKTGPSYNPFWGKSKNEFSVRGATLDEAVSKLEAMVAILKDTPEARLIFTWDD